MFAEFERELIRERTGEVGFQSPRQGDVPTFPEFPDGPGHRSTAWLAPRKVLGMSKEEAEEISVEQLTHSGRLSNCNRATG